MFFFNNTLNTGWEQIGSERFEIHTRTRACIIKWLTDCWYYVYPETRVGVAVRLRPGD